jgi:hypothetical protein
MIRSQELDKVFKILNEKFFETYQNPHYRLVWVTSSFVSRNQYTSPSLWKNHYAENSSTLLLASKFIWRIFYFITYIIIVRILFKTNQLGHKPLYLASIVDQSATAENDRYFGDLISENELVEVPIFLNFRAMRGFAKDSRRFKSLFCEKECSLLRILHTQIILKLRIYFWLLRTCDSNSLRIHKKIIMREFAKSFITMNSLVSLMRYYGLKNLHLKKAFKPNSKYLMWYENLEHNRGEILALNEARDGPDIIGFFGFFPSSSLYGPFLKSFDFYCDLAPRHFIFLNRSVAKRYRKLSDVNIRIVGFCGGGRHYCVGKIPVHYSPDVKCIGIALPIEIASTQIEDWIRRIVCEARLSGIRVIVRAHPSGSYSSWLGEFLVDSGQPLNEFLTKSDFVIGFNSSILIDALLKFVPVGSINLMGLDFSTVPEFPASSRVALSFKVSDSLDEVMFAAREARQSFMKRRFRYSHLMRLYLSSEPNGLGAICSSYSN